MRRKVSILETGQEEMVVNRVGSWSLLYAGQVCLPGDPPIQSGAAMSLILRRSTMGTNNGELDPLGSRTNKVPSETVYRDVGCLVSVDGFGPPAQLHHFTPLCKQRI
jgi:hypothetical protein